MGKLTERSEGHRAVRLGGALFNGDHGRLAEEIARLEEAGIDFVHLDVFDGYFVPDIGFPPRTIEALRPLTKMPLEVHLGVSEPARFIPPLVDAGVDLILVHLECMPMAHETLALIHRSNVRAGVVLALGTPIAALEAIVSASDALLLLSRVTGEGARGGSFDQKVLPRIRQARQLLSAASSECDLQIAGGVNRSNAARLVEDGATTLALGAGIYKVPDMREEIQEIRRIIRET